MQITNGAQKNMEPWEGRWERFFAVFFFDDAHVLELASGVDVCEPPECLFLEGRTMLTRKQSFRLDGNRALFVRDIFIYNIYVILYVDMQAWAILKINFAMKSFPSYLPRPIFPVILSSIFSQSFVPFTFIGSLPTRKNLQFVKL